MIAPATRTINFWREFAVHGVVATLLRVTKGGKLEVTALRNQVITRSITNLVILV